MKARKSLETASATLLTVAVLFGAAPEAHATDYLNPNQNPANRLAKKYAKKIGGQLLSMSRRSEGDTGASSINSSGAASLTVTIDTGRSFVAGSNGKYTFDAFADKVGSNGLDKGDINSVRVAEGSSPSDSQPLFALRLSTPHPHSHAPNEGGARFWYDAQGTAIEPSGERVFFDGSTDPSRYATPPSLVLDRTEIRATGQTMEKIIGAALNDQPTQLETPPFGPLQHIG